MTNGKREFLSLNTKVFELLHGMFSRKTEKTCYESKNWTEIIDFLLKSVTRKGGKQIVFMMTKLEVTDDTFVVRILIEALLLDNGVFSDIVSQAGSFIFKSEKTLSSVGMCKETSQMPTVQVSENSQNISSEFSLPEFFLCHAFFCQLSTWSDAKFIICVFKVGKVRYLLPKIVIARGIRDFVKVKLRQLKVF